MNAPRPQHRYHPPQSRNGALFLEVGAAIVIVGAMLAISLQVVGWTVRERRSVDRRVIALIEAGNLLDEVTGHPWNELTSLQLEQIQLPASAAAALPDARLKLSMRQPEGDPTAKQITLSIDWQGRHGQREGPVRLTAWMFK